MNTYGNAPMTARDSNELGAAINRINDARMQKVENRTTAACGVLLAIALGIAFGMALLDWSTPCDLPSALCGVAAIPAQQGFLRRLQLVWRRAYLRMCISQATAELADLESDLKHSQADCERLPMQIQAHRVWIDAHLDELDQLDASAQQQGSTSNTSRAA